MAWSRNNGRSDRDAANAIFDVMNMILGSKARIGVQKDPTQKKLLTAYSHREVIKPSQVTQLQLLYAVYREYTYDVYELLRRGVDANITYDGTYPIVAASDSGNIDIVHALLYYNARVNVRDYFTCTPLYAASRKGHTHILKVLIRRGADVNDYRYDNGTSCLMAAVSGGHKDTVCELIHEGADVNKQRKDGTFPLAIAIKKGHEDIEKMLLNYSGIADPSCRTALYWASSNGQLEIVKLLKQRSTEVNNVRSVTGNSCLLAAVCGGYTDIVRELVGVGADVDKQQTDGVCPLTVASENGCVEMVKILLEKRACVDIRDQQFRTPLYWSSAKGHTETVKLLLEHGADVNAYDHDGESCLLAAMLGGHTDIACELIQRGADVNKQRNDGACPLAVASEKGYIGIVELLLEKGGRFDTEDEQLRSPMYWASSNGQTDVVELLAERGLNVNDSRDDGTSCILAAVSGGHTNTVRLLAERGADVNKQGKDGTFPLAVAIREQYGDIEKILLDNSGIEDPCCRTALYWASCKGQLKIVKLLIESNVDVSVCSDDGESCLLVAVFGRYTEIVRELVEAGADVDKQRTDGVCPLTVASENGYFDIVKILLENGAYVDIHDQQFRTPLYWGSAKGYMEIVQLLVEHRADVNAFEHDGESCVLAAMLGGHTDIVRELVQRGADVNKQRNDGVCPLAVASEKGCSDIVKLLLENGARIDTEDQNSRSPMYWASCKGQTDVIELLVAHGGDVNGCRDDGTSCLLAAVSGGHTSSVYLLAQRGADVDKQRNDGTFPLAVAIKEQRSDIEEILLNSSGIADPSCHTALYWASCKGQVDTIDADINICCIDSDNRLLAAVYGGCTATVRKLVEAGADVNQQRIDGVCPLIVATENGYVDIVKILLENGASVDIHDQRFRTPLYWSSVKGNMETLQLLVENGADVNAYDHDGESCLLAAIFAGHMHVVRELVQKGADVNKQRIDGACPLAVTNDRGSVDIVKLLLDNGGRFDGEDQQLRLAADRAPSKWQIDVVEAFAVHGVNVHCCRDDASSYLPALGIHAAPPDSQNRVDGKTQESDYGSSIVTSQNANMDTVANNMAIQDDITDELRACLLRDASLLSDERLSKNIHTNSDTSCMEAAEASGNTSLCHTLARTREDANIEHGEQPHSTKYNASDSDNKTPIWSIAGVGKQASVDCPELYCASRRGYTDEVRRLLNAGADINACTDDSESCLLAAVFGGHTEIVRELVWRGADVNKQRRDGACPLIVASEKGSLALVKLLLDKPTRHQPSHAHLLSCLGFRKSKKKRQIPAVSHVKADIRDEQGCTPLYVASSNGNTKIVELLCDRGADVNACARDGTSCLLAGVLGGHIETVRGLLVRGADVNKQRNDGVCPLTAGNQCEHWSIVKMILDNCSSVNVNICDRFNCTPLWWASYRGNTERAASLLERGANVNACRNDGTTCLLAAVLGGHNDTVKFLLSKGALINKQRNDGTCALFAAAERGYSSIVKALLRHDISASSHPNSVVCCKAEDPHVCPHIHRNDNLSPVEVAMLNGWTEVNDRLRRSIVKEYSGEISNPCHFRGCCQEESLAGVLPLQVAVRTRCAELVSSLIQRGASVDSKDAYGNTPLHEAVYYGVDMVRLLIDHGANFNAQNNQGKTPLHIACFYGYEECVNFLVERKAAVSFKDIWGNTALHYMSRKKCFLRENECLEGHCLQNIAGIFTHLLRNPSEISELKDALGNTELHRAVGVYGAMKMFPVSANIREEIDLLLDEGIDIDARNNCGRTPLHVARGEKTLTALLERVNETSLVIKDNRGRNFWHLLATRTIKVYPSFVLSTRSSAIAEGTDGVDDFGRTPLHYAAMAGNGTVIEFFANVAPDSLQAQDMFGRTPFHYYARGGNKSLAIFGRNTGNFQNIPDKMSITPNQYRHFHETYITQSTNVVTHYVSVSILASHFIDISTLLKKMTNPDPVTVTNIRDLLRRMRGGLDSASYAWNIMWNICRYDYETLSIQAGLSPDRTRFTDECKFRSTTGCRLSEISQAVFARIGEKVGVIMSDLSKKIAGKNNQLTCKVVAVGSGFEGTKVDCCDEFDFHFVLTSISEKCEAYNSPELPPGFVHARLKAKHQPPDGTFWNGDRTLNAGAVRFLFEAVVKEIFLTSKFQKKHDIEYVDLVDAVAIPTLYSPAKINVKVEFSFSKPICGYQIMHNIDIDIVPVIDIHSENISQNLADDSEAHRCQLVFAQPQTTCPWVCWSGTCLYVTFTQKESLRLRSSPPVVKAAYMVVKHMVKYFSGYEWFPTYAIKTAVLYCMSSEHIISESSSDRRIYENIDKSELLRWVQMITKRLLCFAVQDYFPIYFKQEVHLPIWQFERHLKFSHMHLYQHGLSFSDLLRADLCNADRDGKPKDTSLETIQKAFVYCHLMHWSVLSDNHKLQVYLPPLINPLREESCWHLFSSER